MGNKILHISYSYLKNENDYQEYSIGGEKDAGLLDRAAVAEEGNDEDEGSDGDEDVRRIFDHGRLHKALEFYTSKQHYQQNWKPDSAITKYLKTILAWK